MRLEGKAAIITGGSTGIGRATAELFAQEGAKVVVADTNVAAGQETVQAIQVAGGQAFFMATDVSNPAQVQQMVKRAVAAYGGVDILFNNAGVLIWGTVLETDEETWQRVLNVNLNGVFLCSKAVLPHMIARGGGSIINSSSSTGAYDAVGGLAAYVTSKGGITLLTKCMALDHMQEGVRVNAIAPGPTDTAMLRDNLSPEDLQAFVEAFPLGRLGRPEEVAQAVLFLASDASSFVTGTILAVDGGQTAHV